jgi:hypothetical protein
MVAFDALRAVCSALAEEGREIQSQKVGERIIQPESDKSKRGNYSESHSIWWKKLHPTHCIIRL